MQNILVPTDFSKNAENALDYALKLSRVMGSPVTVYHACQIPASSKYRPAPPAIEQEKESVLKASQVKLNKVCEKVRESGHECSAVITVSPVFEGIINTSADTGAELIVMGTTGASGFSKWLFGSTTADVIQNSTIPVLAIPEGAAYKQIRKIVFATDYRDSDFSFIKKLGYLASGFGSELGILHVQTGEGEFRSEALFKSFKEKVKAVTDYERTTFHLYEKEEVVDAINNFSNDYKADIISMATSRKNLFDRIFHKSLTREMAYITKIPLLAFKS